MNNPLVNLKLNSWERWLISHLFGSQWQAKLWSSLTASFDMWLADNSTPTVTTVTAFINSHIDALVALLVHGNLFLAAAIDSLLSKVVGELVSALIAYAASKASPATTA